MKLILTLVVSLISLNAFSETKVCSPKGKSKLYLESKVVGKDEEGHVFGEWKFTDGSSDIKNTLNSKFVIVASTPVPVQALKVNNKYILLENRFGLKTKDVKEIQMNIVALQIPEKPEGIYFMAAYALLFNNNKTYHLLSHLSTDDIESISQEKLPAIFDKIIHAEFHGSVENCI